VLGRKVKDDPIPMEDHVVRYCKRQTIGERGNVLFEAFQPRESESFLSVNWPEYVGSSRRRQLKEIRLALSQKLGLGKTAKLAILGVGDVIAKVTEQRALSVLHQPEEEDQSHSGIFGYKHEDIDIAFAIAALVLKDYPAVPKRKSSQKGALFAKG
jgi:hypothetical protein